MKCPKSTAFPSTHTPLSHKKPLHSVKKPDKIHDSMQHHHNDSTHHISILVSMVWPTKTLHFILLIPHYHIKKFLHHVKATPTSSQRPWRNISILVPMVRSKKTHTKAKKSLSVHCVKSVQIRSFFWSVFSCIWTEYGEILRISPYSVRMPENTDQKKLRIWTHFTLW